VSGWRHLREDDDVTFTGFPADAFDFYVELAADPTKSFWDANKARQTAHVRAPLAALCAELADEFGSAHLYRPYRDTRFAKDKTPYKDHQGAFVETQDGVGYYVQVSASGLLVAAGWYAPHPVQMRRYRDAVDGPAGVLLDKAVTTLAASGFQLTDDLMKTRPRGVAEDHPRLDLLRRTKVLSMVSYDVAAWMGTAAALDRVCTDWRALRPLVEWLTDHVGPAETDN
jgi:uncharacterized protein (TIGR02453 family)